MHRIKTIYITIVTLTLLIASCDTHPENNSQLPQQTEIQMQELKEGITVSFANKKVHTAFRGQLHANSTQSRR